MVSPVRRKLCAALSVIFIGGRATCSRAGDYSPPLERDPFRDYELIRPIKCAGRERDGIAFRCGDECRLNISKRTIGGDHIAAWRR